MEPVNSATVTANRGISGEGAHDLSPDDACPIDNHIDIRESVSAAVRQAFATSCRSSFRAALVPSGPLQLRSFLQTQLCRTGLDPHRVHLQEDRQKHARRQIRTGK